LISLLLSGEIFLSLLYSSNSLSSGALEETVLFKVVTSLPDVTASDVVRAIGVDMGSDAVIGIGVVSDICVVSAIGVVMAAGVLRAIGVVRESDVVLGVVD
jgi:hypothetical protein